MVQINEKLDLNPSLVPEVPTPMQSKILESRFPPEHIMKSKSQSQCHELLRIRLIVRIIRLVLFVMQTVSGQKQRVKSEKRSDYVDRKNESSLSLPWFISKVLFHRITLT